MLKQRVLVTALTALLVPSLVGASEFLDGNLGQMNAKAFTAPSAAAALDGIMAQNFDLAGEMQLRSTTTDRLGHTHARFVQTINGMEVIGSDVYMHMDARGTIYGINGDFSEGKLLPTKAALSAEQALTRAMTRAEIAPQKVRTAPQLVYVLGDDGDAYLAWETTVSYTDFNGPQVDRIFADAGNGRMVARFPQHHYVPTVRTYDCNNGTSCGSLASSSSGTINTGDQAIDDAHNYAIATYDYYNNNFGRNSIDDRGMTLRSRVHYSVNYNNAFWNGVEMTYGDGDGVVFVPLSQDADVVAHELTHGVTENDSGLVYRNESGALNEAWSDIFGALVDRQEGANGADIWLLGEDIYTPGTPGDGLRDMADPASEGDYDYYPTRYTGTSDNGGVHWNSGIANLAFVLLVEGGTHPRGKTSVNVTGIGFDAAADIFYAANNSCLTSNSNFEAARNCTASKAASLYGSAAETAVHEAWDAVGVPGGPGGPGGPTCSAAGASCSSNSDCCSNKCRGSRNNKSCR